MNLGNAKGAMILDLSMIHKPHDCVSHEVVEEKKGEKE